MYQNEQFCWFTVCNQKEPGELLWHRAWTGWYHEDGVAWWGGYRVMVWYGDVVGVVVHRDTPPGTLPTPLTALWPLPVLLYTTTGTTGSTTGQTPVPLANHWSNTGTTGPTPVPLVQHRVHHRVHKTRNSQKNHEILRKSWNFRNILRKSRNFRNILRKSWNYGHGDTKTDTVNTPACWLELYLRSLDISDKLETFLTNGDISVNRDISGKHGDISDKTDIFLNPRLFWLSFWPFCQTQ